MKTIHPNFILGISIIIAMLIFALTNRYKPSPVNETLIIDAWTGDLYDIQGNNLSEIHKNFNHPERFTNPKPDKIQ